MNCGRSIRDEACRLVGRPPVAGLADFRPAANPLEASRFVLHAKVPVAEIVKCDQIDLKPNRYFAKAMSHHPLERFRESLKDKPRLLTQEPFERHGPHRPGHQAERLLQLLLTASKSDCFAKRIPYGNQAISPEAVRLRDQQFARRLVPDKFRPIVA